jgi:hypothetical protein
VERPSADAFLEAFDGRFFGPVSPPIVGSLHSDWGAHDGQPSSLTLLLSVGHPAERVAVTNALWPTSARTIVHDLLFRDVIRPFHFPVVVERGKTRISVDGRERVFTTFNYRDDLVATAAIRGLHVAVRCGRRAVHKLQLGVQEPEQFRTLVREANRHLAPDTI